MGIAEAEEVSLEQIGLMMAGQKQGEREKRKEKREGQA